MKLKKFRKLLCISVIGCLVSGLSLAVIPFGDLEGTPFQRAFAVAAACLFWLGLITEILFFVLANSQRIRLEKKSEKKNGKKDGKKTEKSAAKAGIGAVSFFTGREAAAADILTIVSLIVIILLIALKVTNDWLFVIFAVIFFLSFNFHCILNGRNYRYLKENKKNSKKQGEKKDEKSENP